MDINNKVNKYLNILYLINLIEENYDDDMEYCIIKIYESYYNNVLNDKIINYILYTDYNFIKDLHVINSKINPDDYINDEIICLNFNYGGKKLNYKYENPIIIFKLFHVLLLCTNLYIHLIPTINDTNRELFFNNIFLNYNGFSDDIIFTNYCGQFKLLEKQIFQLTNIEIDKFIEHNINNSLSPYFNLKYENTNTKILI